MPATLNFERLIEQSADDARALKEMIERFYA
jgi:hypothetical protein